MSELAWHRYGKAAIRLVKIERGGGADRVVDLTIDVQLEGDFDAVYAGDNRHCIATDTMKNTVYALAREGPIESAEAFAGRVAAHFAREPVVSTVKVRTVEQPWGPIHPHAFVLGAERWTTSVTQNAAVAAVTSGVTNLVAMKTADSAFSGFPRDRYTTLPETEDRLFVTAITAEWVHRAGTADFGARDRIRTALLQRFAEHKSHSVQHTLAAMGAAALGAAPTVDAITLTLPNRHHLLVDLAPFGLDNPNEIFVATDAPYGLIEATIRR